MKKYELNDWNDNKASHVLSLECQESMAVENIYLIFLFLMYLLLLMSLSS